MKEKENTSVNQLSYNEAIVRLEEIVQLLNKPELEIDKLSSLVKEANILISLCKQRLTETDKEVEKLWADRSSEVE